MPDFFSGHLRALARVRLAHPFFCALWLATACAPGPLSMPESGDSGNAQAGSADGQTPGASADANPAAQPGGASGGNAGAASGLAIKELRLSLPQGWKMDQDALAGDTLLFGFANGSEYLTLYAKAKTGIEMKSIFVNGSTVVSDLRTEAKGRLQWKRLETSKAAPTTVTGVGTGSIKGMQYLSSFMAEHNGVTYYGYSRSADSAKAKANVEAFLSNLVLPRS